MLIHIVLLTRKLDRGGAERQLITLAKAFKKNGIDVSVVAFYANGYFDNELINSGVPLYSLGKRSRWGIFSFLITMFRLLRALKPSHLYSFLEVSNILAAVLSPFIGQPKVVWSVRQAGAIPSHYDWTRRAVLYLESLLSACPYIIVTNSVAGKNWAVGRGFPKSKSIVVENGIDTTKFFPDSSVRELTRKTWGVGSGEILIGLVARQDVMKDHANFLKACALVAQCIPNSRFICIGTQVPDYQKSLENTAVQLGIGSKVIWAGAMEDMTAAYNALDISCSSSQFGEGFSNSIAESMACGVPCVVTDVGDSRRIVADLGNVVMPRDSDALASGIVSMISRIKREPSIRIAVRNRIERSFSVETMVEKTLALLR